MQLIDQHTKSIMEGCKERAREAGLTFDDESLEYIVTNRDMLELSPKVMIPTLYDYWVHDVELLKSKGKYELYPSNPYETVINTRPAISYYNDNNPDWLNVMIFYHVLGHIDFFQNNLYFKHTWDDDFTGQALSDKREIARLRSEKGRWVDYVIEFARSIDNLVNYHGAVSDLHKAPETGLSKRIDYYFDSFLQDEKDVPISTYVTEIKRFNELKNEHGDDAEKEFFKKVNLQHPEFEALYKKSADSPKDLTGDVMQFILEHSEFLNRDENLWMKNVVQIVRHTSMYFQPQIRTKIMNEGWASYWHETLFMRDDRIVGHEVDFARVNSAVTSMPRVGLNPYALGMRMFYFIEEAANKGRYSQDFLSLLDRDQRSKFDTKTGCGQDYIFQIRENMNDFLFVSTFIEQDFLDLHKLFVADKVLDEQRMVWRWFVKSRKAADYKKMVSDQLYHPPSIRVDPEQMENGTLYLDHRFEEKPLVREFLNNTMLGLEFLWGNKVMLETTEVKSIKRPESAAAAPGTPEAAPEPEVEWQKVRYTMQDKKLSKGLI